MRVLFDTNIVLDVLLARAPWATASSAVWKAHDTGAVTGFLCASTLTDIFYVVRKAAKLETARVAVRTCLDTFHICEVNRASLEVAEALPGTDFEDNLQIACANLSSLAAIVTRDKSGFADATLPVWTPDELLAQIELHKGELK